MRLHCVSSFLSQIGLALVLAFPVHGEIQNLTPGDIGTVPITVHNESDSEPLEGVAVTAVLPAFFIPVEEVPPVNIPPGRNPA